MTAVIDSVKEKQSFKISEEYTLEFPEPFFFIVKVPGRNLPIRSFTRLTRQTKICVSKPMRTEILKLCHPPFPETSRKNWDINIQLGNRARKDKTGVCFESSAKFTLPNGAKRMPDAAWILKERYFAHSEKERSEKFTNISPDFVIELRSNRIACRFSKEKCANISKTMCDSAG